MSKKLVLVSCIGLAFVLSACSNEKEASVKNFTKPLQEYVDQLNYRAVCLNVPRSDSYFSEDELANKFAVFYKNAEERPPVFFSNPEKNFSQMKYFEKMGLVSEESTSFEKRFFNDVSQIQVFAYTLTDAGKAALVVKNGGLSKYFCSGKVVLDKIDFFTEPTQSGPVQVSQVTYTMKYEGQEGWATSDEAKNLFESDIHYASLTGEAIMVLTNEGWKVDTSRGDYLFR